MKKRQRGSAVCQQFRGIGAYSTTSKNAPGIYRCTACQFAKNERKDFIYEKFRKRTEAWKKWNRKSVH